jgi:hypothetical protein
MDIQDGNTSQSLLPGALADSEMLHGFVTLHFRDYLGIQFIEV